MPTPTFQGAPPVIRPNSPPLAKQVLDDEISDVGKEPLIEDKGWESGVSKLQAQREKVVGRQSGTRLPSELAESEYKIKSNKIWYVVILLLVLGAAGGGVAALAYWKDLW